VNVKQAVPFFGVTSMDVSLRFYVETLGFTMKNRWIDDGKLRWCWLALDDVAIMLQEFTTPPEPPRGNGVTICFICDDALALYRVWKERGVAMKRPFVGNNSWVVELTDPDGYRLLFESDSDAPEESEY